MLSVFRGCAIAPAVGRAVFAAAWLVLAAAARAEAPPLTLAQALARTLTDSPQLALYPFDRRINEADRLQAGLRPAPELSLEVENVAGSGDFRRADSAEYTLALSQLIELGDKRGQRLAVAEQRLRGVDQDYALARLDTLGEAARRFIEAARAQALVEWSAHSHALATRAQRAATEREAAGAAGEADVARFQLGAIRAELAQQRAAAQWRQARVQLAASWGARGADFERVAADLRQFPRLPARSALEQALASSPRLARLLSEERLRQAQLRLAESGAAPDLTVGLGVRRLAETDDNALVLSFSMPLRSGSRNRGATDAAQAALAKTGAEQQLAEVELRALLHTLYQQLVTTRAEAGRLRAEVLPAAQRALAAVERGYRAGRFSALELIAAQDERLALERETIEAEAAFHLQIIELERLTGQPLTTTGPAAQAAEVQP